jgi:KDO2-lipid IV(A) lauroyltransferase
MKNFLSFLIIRLVTTPIAWLPYRAVHALGRVLGTLAYYLIPKFRKRALSNLAIASDLKLSNLQIVQLAKESMQNLMITCLEYAKLASESSISKIVTCENPAEASAIMKNGKAVIFFCAHQANWELLFLEGTSRMPGVAIGRPIKNKQLYNWVMQIRQKFGGKIVAPKEAIKEGLRALKKGMFLGIVGDQGMPDSGFRCPFLGKMAWTSPMPALLSYRTGSPIIFAAVRRAQGHYFIHYSEPLWPNQAASMESEIDRLMRASLALLEDSIKQQPGQWLWVHNRWKQQTLGRVKRRFRQESLLIILPHTPSDELLSHLSTFRSIYPLEFITLMVPQGLNASELIENAEILTYASDAQMCIEDYRFKLVFNFTNNSQVRRHFLSLAAFEVVSLEDLHKLAGDSQNLSEILNRALCHA